MDDGARFAGEQLLALLEIRIETCVNSHVILSLYTRRLLTSATDTRVQVCLLSG